MKRGNFSDRVRNIVIEEIFLPVKTDQWNRQESFEILSNPYWSCAWSTATVRSRESLVKIEMNNVEPHVPRTNLPQYRVEVRTIIVQETPGVMNCSRNLENILLENPESVRIGDHQTRCPRPRNLSESVKINHAFVV